MYVFALQCMKGTKILNITVKPGTGISPEETAAIGELSCLDKPIVTQYELYMKILIF